MTQLTLQVSTRTPAGARCRVGVIGLGYAGLPQAVAFAEAGHPVTGVDNRPEVTAMLREGRSPVDTVSDDRVRRVGDALSALDDTGALAECSAVVVCVPTPVDAAGEPDLSALRAACATVAAHLRPGQLVVIESTVYPGVTDGVVRDVLERSGLVAGVHFSLAHVPERVDPGNPVFDSADTSRVIGGLTPVCALRAEELYGGVVSGVHITAGLREAEATKVLENTYRQVNLGLVHEFAAYCDALGIDAAAVIDAAATKPFGFQPFYPGVGVGGHCIPVDPLYLAHSARAAGTPLHLVELAQRINDERPVRVVDVCETLLRTTGTPLAGAEVLVLGVSYKPDVSDVRNTPVVPLVRELTARGAQVRIHDPHVPELVVDGMHHKSVSHLGAVIAEADLVLVAQHHSVYDTEHLHRARLVYDPRRHA
ncbi:nucleotide sugar dehydrogenase [Streptomyces sp. NPDC020597]|uniref:nucleotide sugar dehydrogenase n=1 Tax=unclassified Streptomyces TaxID=2593676 RepID=UPI00379A438E